MWKSLEPWAVRLPNSKHKAPIGHSGGNLKDNAQLSMGKEGQAHEVSKEREDSTRIWARVCSGGVWAKNLAALCPCPKNLSGIQAVCHSCHYSLLIQVYGEREQHA